MNDYGALHSHLERNKIGCVPQALQHIKLGRDKELNITNEIIKTRRTYELIIYNMVGREIFLSRTDS